MTQLPGFVSDNHGTRILIRATNWIGDSVMTMPAVQRLRELAPGAYIAMLCPGKLTDLWRHNPFINEVIPFGEQPDLHDLRERAFNVAVIFPTLFAPRGNADAPESRAASALRTLAPLPLDGRRPPAALGTRHLQDEDRRGKTFQVKVFRSMRHQSEQYLDIISYLAATANPSHRESTLPLKRSAAQ